MNMNNIVAQLDQEIERLQKARSFLMSPTTESNITPVSRRGGRRPGAGRPRKIRLEASVPQKVYAEPTVKRMVRDREMAESK